MTPTLRALLVLPLMIPDPTQAQEAVQFSRGDRVRGVTVGALAGGAAGAVVGAILEEAVS
jgi:hypothetical protein